MNQPDKTSKQLCLAKSSVCTLTDVRTRHVLTFRRQRIYKNYMASCLSRRRGGGLYLTHFTPQSGSAIHMMNELYTITLAFGEHVKALGCDGTAANTGTSGGVCRLFELATDMSAH